MNPSGDSSNSAQGRARVPGSPGGYDHDPSFGRPVSSGSVGRASVGRASVGAAAGSAPVSGVPGAVGRASVGRAPVGPGPDILTGPGGLGSSLPPERRTAKGPRAKRGRRRTIILAVIAVFVMLSGGAVVGGGYYFDSVQLPGDIQLPQSTTTITYSDGTPMANIGQVNRIILPQDQISETVKDAVVATEDATFYTNHGVDFKGVLRAIWNNATGGDKQGASTITQQYVRNAFDLKGVSYARKIREAVMAMKIDQSYKKDEILSFYLNTVYFGNGAYGVEAAAQTYFGKSQKDLTVAEAMVLAAVIKDPEGKQGFNPTINPDGAKERWNNYVKAQMVKLGYLKPADADKLVYPTNVRKTAMNIGQLDGNSPTMFIVHQVMNELLYQTGGKFTEDQLNQGGYKIVTTINKKYEDAAVSILNPDPKSNSLMAKQPTNLAPALASIDPKTGRVLAYYGGANGSGLDQAGIWRDPITPVIGPDGKALAPDHDWHGNHHSPGSTFKMYTLAAALSQGYSIDGYWYGPTTRTFSGRPTPVSNSDNEQCEGPRVGVPPAGQPGHVDGVKSPSAVCTLQQALKASLNTVYFAVGNAVGAANVLNMAHAMGVEHIWDDAKNRYDLVDTGDGKTKVYTAQEVMQTGKIGTEVSIGQYGITVLDNASGLATIANRGVHFERHFVLSVSKGTQVVYREVTKNTDLSTMPGIKLNRDQLADEQWAMSTVMDNSGGKNKLTGARPAGAKTGTWEYCATLADCGGNKAYLNQTKDAWYAGFTPDLATAVWVGSGDPNKNPIAQYYQANSKSLSVMYGISLPGDIWKKFMDTALNTTAKDPLPAAKHVPGTKDGEALQVNQGDGNNDGNGNNGNGNGNNGPGNGNNGPGNNSPGNGGNGNNGPGNGQPGQQPTTGAPRIHF